MTKKFRNIHIYLSLFFLPVALVYILSGSLFILGFDDDIFAQKQELQFKAEAKEGQEQVMLFNYLKEQNITLPKLQYLHSENDNALFTLGTLRYSMELEKLDDETFDLLITTRSILGLVMALHESDNNSLFDILAIGFALTLFVLYLSGIMITLYVNKKNRKSQYLTILAGCIICIAFAVQATLF